MNISQLQEDMLSVAKTDTAFVGDLALIVFGEKTMRESSFTGAQCRNKAVDPKPALDKNLVNFIYGKFSRI